MNRLQLAQLVEWAGEVKTRKRLQKVVYLLQAAGCPLEIDFTLHHYGPYSHELAALTDQMVSADLLVESSSRNVMLGQSYEYKLSTVAQEQLHAFAGDDPAGLADFKDLAERLLNEPSLHKLEYAATIAYFRMQGREWPEAVAAAAKFKNLNLGSQIVKDAEQLARGVLEAA
jgi:uncharacterized protein YwgA